MGALSKQARGALRHVPWEWSQEVEDPRAKRGRRHAHPGVLGLLVAAFACAKVGLEEAEELSEDLGPRTRKKLKLTGRVSDSTLWRVLKKQSAKGLPETLRQWVKALLAHSPLPPLLPLGVASFDGKSLYTSTQQPVPGLESVAYDEKGNEVWKLGALRAALTSVAAAPCLDMEFISAKAGREPGLPSAVASGGGALRRALPGDDGGCGAVCRGERGAGAPKQQALPAGAQGQSAHAPRLRGGSASPASRALLERAPRTGRMERRWCASCGRTPWRPGRWTSLEPGCWWACARHTSRTMAPKASSGATSLPPCPRWSWPSVTC